MRALLATLAVVLFWCAPALACDDHHGKCTFDGFRAQHNKLMNAVSIDASATCDKGHARIRLYNGGNFIGVATGYIDGHVLEALSFIPEDASIADLTIKYSIEPR